MTVKLLTKHRGKPPGESLRQIGEVLKQYAAAHPAAKIEAYQQNSVSVKIRVLDPAFKGLGPAKREEELWKLFEQLPEEVVADITVLLLFTPDEAKTSFANMEFDHPVSSALP